MVQFPNLIKTVVHSNGRNQLANRKHIIFLIIFQPYASFPLLFDANSLNFKYKLSLIHKRLLAAIAGTKVGK